MPGYVIGNFLVYAVINAFTPGPGNILALNTITNYGWKKGFLLQFVNVKIYLFGITALTGYVTDYSTELWVLVFFELVIATIGTIATSSWIAAGMAIQKIYLRHYRPINIILALTLLECGYSMLK